MKKLFFAIIALAALLTACESSPKTYEWGDLSFTYPAAYEVETIKEDDDMIRLCISKDDDNFMLAELREYDMEDIESLSRDEIQEAIESDAMSLYMLDEEDENMTIDGNPEVVTSPEGSAPGVLFMYSGTHYEDVIKARISVTVIRNYEVILRYEGTEDKAMSEMLDIATSFDVTE